jgi:anti-sigma-K factor RskA
MSNHTHAPSAAFDDALAAYALGALDAGEGADALDAAERSLVEAQLASCAACREELADLQRAVTSIGLSESGEEPPPALRDKVMQVTRTAEGRVVNFHGRDGRHDRRPRAVLPWLAAAAVVLIAASGWYVVTSRRATAAVEARNSVMNAPDVMKVELKAQPDAPGSSAYAFMSPQRGMVLMAEHLPALQRGRTYQLWVVTKQAPVSVGMFTVEPDGSMATMMPLTAEAMLNPVAVAVTIEPEGGMPSPTGPKVLVGMLSPQ